MLRKMKRRFSAMVAFFDSILDSIRDVSGKTVAGAFAIAVASTDADVLKRASVIMAVSGVVFVVASIRKAVKARKEKRDSLLM